MSIVNNIAATPTTGIIATPQMQGIGGMMNGGLAGFFTLLLGQLGQTGQAGMATLPQPAQTGTIAADLQGIAEKIAAQLAADPALAVKKMTGAPALIPDLAAGNIDMNVLAAALSGIEPGAEDGMAVDEAGMQQIALMMNDIAPGAEQAPLNPDILDTLRQALNKFVKDNGAAASTPEKISQFKTDAAQFLRSLGLDEQTVARYFDALPASLGEQASSLAAPLGLTLDTPDSSQPLAPAAAPAAPAAAGLAADDVVPPTKPRARGTPAPDAPDAQKPARADQPQPADNGKQAAAPKQSATSHLALINAMQPQDDAASREGFGKILQGDMSFNAPRADQSLQGLHNYLQPARTTASHTTQMVALQIQKNAAAKIDSFILQLEPADLGRLDIKMHFDHDGSVRAHLTAERPETLALLQRDHAQLDRLLQQAGLSTDENSLSFDLREQNRDQAAGQDRDREQTHYRDVRDSGIMQANIAVTSAGYITQSGVDIRV